MKLLAKEIEIITVFDKYGNIKPVRFRTDDNVIKIDRVNDIAESKFAGENALIYKCQSFIKDSEKLFELKFDKRTCKWYLYKM